MLDCLMIDCWPDTFLIQSGDHAEAKLKGYYTHKHAGTYVCIYYYILTLAMLSLH